MTDLTAEDLIAVMRGHDEHTVDAAIEAVKDADRHPAVQNGRNRGYQFNGKGRRARLQKMRTKHCTIANMHAAGLSNATIAVLTGATPSWISTLLHEPIVKEYIETHVLVNLEKADEKSKGMLLRAVETVSDIIDSGDSKTRLAAAKIAIDMNQKAGTTEPDSAEDVIKRALEVVREDGTRVTMTEERKKISYGKTHSISP